MWILDTANKGWKYAHKKRKRSQPPVCGYEHRGQAHGNAGVNQTELMMGA